MLERMEGIENGLPGEGQKTNLTFGRAISNLRDAEHSVNGKDREYLAGIRQNLEGFLGYISDRPLLKAVTVSAGAILLSQIAAGCASRTATAQDMIATTTAITENYEPTPTAEFTPELKVTKEPTKDASGNYIPVSERFANSGLGKITSIEEADPLNPIFTEIYQKSTEKFGVGSKDVNVAAFVPIGENGKSLYVLVANRTNGNIYSLFSSNEDDLYIPPAIGKDMQFLPMMTIDRPSESKKLSGFDVDGSLVNVPFIIDKKTNKMAFVDPSDPTNSVEIPLDTSSGAKVLALLTNPKESIGIGDPTPTPTPTESYYQLSPEKRIVRDFENLGVTPDQYTITKDENGKFKVFKTGTKTEIYSNEKFNYDFIFSIARQTCELTGVKPLPGTHRPANEDINFISKYLDDLLGRDLIEIRETSLIYSIDNTEYCWVVANDSFFYFRDKDGLTHRVPVFDLDNRKGSQGLWK